MSVHIHTAQGGRAIGSHLPLNVALAILPTLPRPYLARLVANAIDLLDLQDGDADLEPDVTEQDDEPEGDDEPEEDDPDTSAEDAPEGFDPESDYCLAHEDLGSQGWLVPREKKEVRRLKQLTRDLRRMATDKAAKGK